MTTVAEREGIAILPWSPLKGGWLSGKMKREEGKAPVGSRVHAQTKDGVKRESGPNWSDLASKDHTWHILEKLKEIADRNKKSVANVATRCSILSQLSEYHKIIFAKLSSSWQFKLQLN